MSETKGPGRPKTIKFKTVFLHQAIFWPGHPTESTISDTKFKGIQMTEGQYGITLEHHGDKTLIPWPNVANCVFEK